MTRPGFTPEELRHRIATVGQRVDLGGRARERRPVPGRPARLRPCFEGEVARLQADHIHRFGGLLQGVRRQRGARYGIEEACEEVRAAARLVKGRVEQVRGVDGWHAGLRDPLITDRRGRPWLGRRTGTVHRRLACLAARNRLYRIVMANAGDMTMT